MWVIARARPCWKPESHSVSLTDAAQVLVAADDEVVALRCVALRAQFPLHFWTNEARGRSTRHIAEIPRRLAIGLLEAAVEITLIAESGPGGDFGNAPAGVL